jgi:hypothetical protein
MKPISNGEDLFIVRKESTCLWFCIVVYPIRSGQWFSLFLFGDIGVGYRPNNLGLISRTRLETDIILWGSN